MPSDDLRGLFFYVWGSKNLTTFLTTLYDYLGLIGVNWGQDKNKKKPCDTNDFVDITRLTA